jgi:hypothetical protein
VEAFGLEVLIERQRGRDPESAYELERRSVSKLFG